MYFGSQWQRREIRQGENADTEREEGKESGKETESVEDRPLNVFLINASKLL